MTNKKNSTFTLLVMGLLMLSFPAIVSGQKKENGFVSIFDGKTLKGWEGDANYWRVENGSLVGEITADKLLKSNTFIIWRGGEPTNFELTLEYRMTPCAS